jgi:hypothetical protein
MPKIPHHALGHAGVLKDHQRQAIGRAGYRDYYLDCDPTHLRQIYINYEEKDKIIQDNKEDIADLFCELTKRVFFNCPLSRLYMLGEEDIAKKDVADRLTTISCWLQNLVISRLKKSRGSGWAGI